MADNVELSAGSGGAIIAADDIGPGVWYQRVKINHGADGSATDVSAASPLPVIGGSNSGVDIGDVTVNNGVGAAAVPIQDGGNSITVDGAVTVSGTVTADLGATDNAVLDDIAAKLGTIDTDTSALAGAISGTEVQVDIVSLPAVDTELTTADLDTGGGTDTRAVVGLVGSADGGGELIPGSAAAGLLVNLGTNNDVTVTGTVDLGATDNAVLDAIAASVAAIDTDATTIIGHVDGIEGLLTTIDADTSTLAAVDYATGADVASLGVTGGGAEATALRVTIASDSTGVLSVDDGGGALTVDGAVTVSGTVTADLGATDNAVLDDIAAKLATIDADTSALFGTVGGTELQVDIVSSAAIPVTDNSGSLTVDNAGTFAVQAGQAAHDAAISGNPVRIAGRALSADYTAVATGDTADIMTSLTGKVTTLPYAIPASTWSYAAASGGITNTTGVTAKAAGAAGVRNYITRVQVINGHATVSTDVQIRDGASGTVLWRGFAQAAGGGVSAEFDPPLRGTANTLVEVACGTTGTATYFNLQGYTAAE